MQALIERWEVLLPNDLQRYSPMLNQIEGKSTLTDDVTVSRLPLVVALINTCVDGALDVLD